MGNLLPGRLNTESGKDYETCFFREVSDLVKKEVGTLEERSKTLKETIAVFQEQYAEGDYEVASLIDNAANSYRDTVGELKAITKKAQKPYFGRIIFDNDSVYIGRTGIRRDQADVLVADWRAPISNAYYENGLGNVSFKTPLGDDVNINLTLKRTFDISDGKLNDYYDSEAATDDELLNKYLAKNKQAVLNEIIATIQKEQNDIIRMSPKHNLIVQGVAGSGKTTVAMHRISYLLYNYGDYLKPESFYVIGSNKMLLKYITGVLPDLGVDGFGQMTMEELFTRLMYTDWDHFRYAIRETDNSDPAAALKGKEEYFEALKAFLDKYERNVIKTEDVMLYPDQFTEGFENGVAGIYDRRDNPTGRKSGPVCLLRGSAIKKYIDDNPQFSVQTKTDFLNNEIKENLENELSYKGMSYTEKERKAIRSAYRCPIGEKEFKGSIYKIYDDFISTLENADKLKPTYRYEEREVTWKAGKKTGGKGQEVLKEDDAGSGEARSTEEIKPPVKTARVKITEYDVYDLAALAYIHHRVNETHVISEANHIVIDEAQDYGMMAYLVLKECVHDCKYTIMGDVSQNIRYTSGLNDWTALRKLYLTNAEYDGFMMLRKSYRNTIEISHFATNILKHGTFEIYPSEPIIRHGEEPAFIKGKKADLPDKVAELCREYEKEGLFSIAVVCRDQKKADALKEKLKGKIELVDTDTEDAEYGQGVMVLPVTLTKGLEFDAVIIYDPDKKSYPADNSHVKLLFVAATRALHKLCIVHSGDITELFDKVDEGSATRFFAEEKHPKVLSREEQRKAEDDKRNFMENEENLSKEKVLAEAERRTKEYLASRTGASRTDGSSEEIERRRAEEKERIAGAEKTTGFKSNENGMPSITGAERNTKGGRISGKEDQNGGKFQKDFLSEVPQELLKPSGHAVGSFATKWINKKNDGIYFQSQNGIIRLQPIAPNIVRVSYSKGLMLDIPKSDAYKSFQLYKDFGYKDSSQTVEITLKKMMIRYDRYRGAFTFYDGAKREILKESQNEARYYDEKKKPPVMYTFFEGKSSDVFYIHSAGDGSLNYLASKALYINEDGKIPCIIKKEKYAIIPLTTSKAALCRMPVVGTFIMQEDAYSDYYLVVDDNTDRLVENYHKLTGK